MTCPDFEILSLYLDNELPDRDKMSVQEHIKQCAICQKEIETIAAYDKDLHNSLNAFVKLNSRKNEIMAAVRKEKLETSSAETFSFGFSSIFTKLAFVMVITLIFGVLVVFKLSPDHKIYKGNVQLATYRALEKGAMLNNKECHPNFDKKLSLGKKINYRGEFEFSLPKKELTLVTWNGSGSFVFNKAYEIEFDTGDGFFVARQGSPVKVKFKDGEKLITNKKLSIKTPEAKLSLKKVSKVREVNKARDVNKVREVSKVRDVNKVRKEIKEIHPDTKPSVEEGINFYRSLEKYQPTASKIDSQNAASQSEESYEHEETIFASDPIEIGTDAPNPFANTTIDVNDVIIETDD